MGHRIRDEVKVEGVFPAKGKHSNIQHHSRMKRTQFPILLMGQTSAEGANGKNPLKETNSPLSLQAVAQGLERGPGAPFLQHCPTAACSSSSENPNQQAPGTTSPHYLWKRMDFTRVTTSRLALCPAHTIAT